MAVSEGASRREAQAAAQRGDRGGGVEEDGEEVEGRTLGPVVPEAQVALAELGGVVVDVAGGEGILVLAHGSLLGWLAYHKSF